VSDLCCDLSLSAGEELGATATTADDWLLVEVPGAWERDVGGGAGLPEAARDAVTRWLGSTRRRRLQFIRRPGRREADLLVFVVRAEERRSEVRRIELRALDGLAEVDFQSAGDVVERSLVLVCGHGSRDRCCAVRGTELFAALEARLAEEELWLSSHQGGHRFAPNLLVLPAGLQFGRLRPTDALLLTARALAGRIELERYRGRTCYDGGVQAAELAVRGEARLDGVSDVVLESVEDAVVTLQARDGSEYTVVVDEVAGPPVAASCGAELEPQPHFAARSVTVNPGSSLGAGRPRR
jgi:hypothetical protein